ncbi:hypothetical protein ALQ76_101796 [Pseudomonas syringae pv. atrofaciens]|uniref:Uncharacterized protein n=1 Tax=Pseudomonas syringae pv. lapsa TaxID=199201 RepID=A0AB74A8S3_PSESX|nr:hypothetical protein ALO39_101448 [Pseudomonas syringae pv. lapsa]RML18237.1 hypothetical protein ALQ99_101320 [Pseudomonas syringae pv. lapsa]RML27431.1 hypothetical protein ALQ98_101158 [Pseudomonas syringae pv. lapsa]RMM54561.1 hypothetical protein ALQ76_101796 [Pseudomonas syringae pv. atrofaciens]
MGRVKKSAQWLEHHLLRYLGRIKPGAHFSLSGPLCLAFIYRRSCAIGITRPLVIVCGK